MSNIHPATPPPGEHPAGWVEGIDIADPQRGSVDYAALPDWVKFAWVKFTDGSGGRDPARIEHSDGLSSRGVHWGPYHFFQDEQDPIKQARHFRDTVGGRFFEMPPAIDVERPYFDSATSWSIKSIRARTIAARAAECVQEIERLFARPCVVYTLEQYWAAAPDELASFMLWLSRYHWDGWPTKRKPNGMPFSGHTEKTRPKTPKPWAAWQFWQFAGNDGEVPGVKVACDRNYFAGNQEQFDAWLDASQWKTSEPPATIEDPMGEVALKLKLESERLASNEWDRVS